MPNAQARDAWFMTASLYFLLHKYEDCQVVLERDIAAGDQEPSTLALKDVLDKELSGELAAPEPADGQAAPEGPRLPDEGVAEPEIIAWTRPSAFEVIRTDRYIEIRPRTASIQLARR